jgi:hypothetical protein
MARAVPGRALWAHAICTRALIVVRHHYFSLLTAGVLGGVALVAITSPSFEDPTPSAENAQEDEARWAPTGKRTFATQGRSLVYYIVDSDEQAVSLDRALRSDMVSSEMAGGRHDFGVVYYLQPRTPREEADVARLLNLVVESAPNAGFIVKIIDLRPEIPTPGLR